MFCTRSQGEALHHDDEAVAVAQVRMLDGQHYVDHAGFPLLDGHGEVVDLGHQVVDPDPLVLRLKEPFDGVVGGPAGDMHAVCGDEPADHGDKKPDNDGKEA